MGSEAVTKEENAWMEYLLKLGKLKDTLVYLREKIGSAAEIDAILGQVDVILDRCEVREPAKYVLMTAWLGGLLYNAAPMIDDESPNTLSRLERIADGLSNLSATVEEALSEPGRIRSMEEITEAPERETPPAVSSEAAEGVDVAKPEKLQTTGHCIDDKTATGAAEPDGGQQTTDGTPHLDAEDVAILRALAKTSMVLHQSDIEASTPIARKTVGLRLKAMRAQGLTVRPKGPNGGEAITGQGRQALAKCGSGSTRK